MSTSPEAFAVGQKVLLLLNTGQASSKRYEIVKVWRYPTTFRYQLDSGYVADHAELRPVEDVENAPTAASKTVDATAPAPES